MSRTMLRSVVVLVLLGLAVAPGLAHITPPVVLVSDRDALLTLLSGASRFFVREVRLSGPEREQLQQRAGWQPDEDFYRFYIGRSSAGQLVAAVVFVTDFTIHGPVRVAVALGGDGRVKGARVVELTEETYVWVKPLLDRDFTRTLVGQSGQAAPPAAVHAGDPMSQFYAEVIAGLVRRAAALFEVAVRQHGGAA